MKRGIIILLALLISVAALTARGTAVAAPTQSLSAAEADGLRYMREEEKLARDVYTVLFDRWGLRIFQNIASSEQQHMDRVGVLLERYGLADPTAGMQPGVFSDPTLQQLYTQLVAQGQISLGDALKVGATIEEVDIVDLQARLTPTTAADITQTYTALLHGSHNHLRAFVRTLQRQTGETYQPQYLDQATYAAIINTPAETNPGNGRRNGPGGPR